jgi:hypothetical protein
VVRLEGCDGASPSFGVSAVSAGNTAIVPIPQSYLDANAEKYFIVEGNYTSNGTSGKVLRSWIAPRVKIVKDDTMSLHFTADAMVSIRAQIAQDLVKAGKIDAAQATDATEFAKHFDFVYGFMGTRTMGASDEPFVYNATWSLDGDMNADQSSCSPKTQCCVYYANGFDAVFRKPTPAADKIIDTTKTSADRGYFAIVCPDEGSGKTEITMTLKPSAMLLDELGAPVDSSIAAKFAAPFTVPLRHGEATLFQYFPY